MTFISFAPAAFALFVTLLAPAATRDLQSGSVATEQIFKALALQEGNTVCEMGAGDGELSVAAARVVGSQGRVYTSELGEDRLKALRQKVAASAAVQITVVDGAPTTTNFPDASCDALYMRNVYHHFANPAAMNASIAASLKPGGRLAIVDFSPPPGSEAPTAAERGKDGMHGITADTLARELKEAGFEPISTAAGAQRWFMVVVAKPPAR